MCSGFCPSGLVAPLSTCRDVLWSFGPRGSSVRSCALHPGRSLIEWPGNAKQRQTCFFPGAICFWRLDLLRFVLFPSSFQSLFASCGFLFILLFLDSSDRTGVNPCSPPARWGGLLPRLGVKLLLYVPCLPRSEGRAVPAELSGSPGQGLKSRPGRPSPGGRAAQRGHCRPSGCV